MTSEVQPALIPPHYTPLLQNINAPQSSSAPLLLSLTNILKWSLLRVWNSPFRDEVL
jgi:hypothetical protein